MSATAIQLVDVPFAAEEALAQEIARVLRGHYASLRMTPSLEDLLAIADDLGLRVQVIDHTAGVQRVVVGAQLACAWITKENAGRADVHWARMALAGEILRLPWNIVEAVVRSALAAC